MTTGFVQSVDRVMLQVGSVQIYWYGLAYTFGFVGLLLWLVLQRNRLGWTRGQAVNSCIIFILAVMIGGRLFEVAVYEWPWYRERLAEIPMFWKGGMATHGLFLGAAVAAALVAHSTRTSLLRVLDSLVVPAAFIFGVGRIGNFIEGGVIGTPTELPWGVAFPGVEGFRHPVALYDGAKNLMLVPVLAAVLRRWPAGNGIATAVFLIGYGGLRFLVDQFRDYESALFGLGPGQWFNLTMAAAGLGLLVVRLKAPAGSVPPAVQATPEAYEGSATHGVRHVVRAVLLVALILFPLCIPNSWTSDYIEMKRHMTRN